ADVRPSDRLARDLHRPGAVSRRLLPRRELGRLGRTSGRGRRAPTWQPVVKVWLHSGPPARLPRWGPRSTGDASPAHPNAAAAVGTPAGAALLLLQILAVFSVVAPCPRGASPVSVRRQTFTPGCSGASRNQMSCSR